MSDDSNPNLRIIEDTLTTEELRREPAPARDRDPDPKEGHWLGSAGGQLRRLRVIVRALAKENERLRAQVAQLEQDKSELLKGKDIA